MNEATLFLLQRLSALILAPLVVLHLGLIFYAVQGGLTADEILGRTQGNVAWAIVYGLFVVMAALHAGLGMRNIIAEWSSLNARSVDAASIVIALVLLVLGLRAVYAVVAP